MSSVAKDQEVLTAIPDSSANSDSPRPQPVALEVPVSVNGVRTVAGSEKREPFSETTKTVLIFGNGAVVRLSSSVAPGQLLFLTNDKTRKEVVCQVVKSKNYQNVSGYVELEFTEAVANFWGMRFPAGTAVSGTPAAAVAASAAASSSVSTSPSVSTSASIATPPSASTSSSHAPEAESKSSVANSSKLGSSPQTENTAPRTASASASSSRAEKTSKVVEFAKPKSSAPVAVPAQPATPPAGSRESSLDSEEVKIPAWLEPLARNAAAASAAPRPTGDTHEVEEHADFTDAVEIEDPIPAATIQADQAQEAAATRAVPPPSSYGTHFLAEEKSSVASASAAVGGSDKKLLIIGIAAAILFVAGGGAAYLQQQRSSNQVNEAAPVGTAAPGTTPAANGSQPGSSTTTPAGQPAGSTTPSTMSNSEPTGPVTSSTAPATPASPKSANFVDSATSASAETKSNKRLVTVDAPAEPAAAPKKAMLGVVSLSAPVLTKRAVHSYSPEEALNLEAGVPNGGTEGLGSGLVTNSKQPAAPPSPVVRPVGGQVKVASLISSYPPLYPERAKAQKVDGDVKIDALIGVNGRVNSMKIISGPTLLRDPALDAVKHWKYQPGTLNGEPVAMHLTVTVQFKLQ